MWTFAVGLVLGVILALIYRKLTKCRTINISAVVDIIPPPTPTHQVTFYLTSTESYTQTAVAIDGMVSIVERTTVEYVLRDRIGSHYLAVYGDALDSKCRDMLLAVAVSRVARVVSMPYADYEIQFVLRPNLNNLGLFDKTLNHA